ncbi:MAG TPA: hypothetical protein PLU87_00635 [Sedimentisphaerales bacterium]|nr:hypothetical protein [Sedimentisphaerales bacterium]HRS09620.1 hypothetical protein [Sedimentisphaerales bacterium]HRV46301.1 hypothetical protein [Sedimentisphaerales bacterium]
MKPIEVADKTPIKQLLYPQRVFGIKGDQFCGFGGFQLWWYDRQRGQCDCGDSHRSDPRKLVTHHSLDEAARILWHHPKGQYIRVKRVDEDRGIQALEHLEDARH